MTQNIVTLLPEVASEPVHPLDALAETYSAIWREYFDAGQGGAPAAALRRTLAKSEMFLKAVADLDADLQAALAPLDLPEIAAALRQFVLAWPNASKADLAGYGAHLISDVHRELPCRRALDEAMRLLRRNSKFLPSIAEVLAEISAVQRRMRNLAYQIGRKPAFIEKLRAEVEKQERVEAHLRERAERHAARHAT